MHCCCPWRAAMLLAARLPNGCCCCRRIAYCLCASCWRLCRFCDSWTDCTGNWFPELAALKAWFMGEAWKFMGDICGAWGFCAGEAVFIRWPPIWPGAKCWLCIVGEGVLVKACWCWKPNWACCEGVWERDSERAAPVESRFWGTDGIGLYGRAPFIWGFAMALGSMKLEGSYIPFWGDWKSMMVRYCREWLRRAGRGNGQSRKGRDERESDGGT